MKEGNNKEQSLLGKMMKERYLSFCFALERNYSNRQRHAKNTKNMFHVILSSQEKTATVFYPLFHKWNYSNTCYDKQTQPKYPITCLTSSFFHWEIVTIAHPFLHNGRGRVCNWIGWRETNQSKKGWMPIAYFWQRLFWTFWFWIVFEDNIVNN